MVVNQSAATGERLWLIGGLGARDPLDAPGHTGYLVERWPLMVVPHSADILPDAWDTPPPGAARGEEALAAPYAREIWNGEPLSHFLTSAESEWHRWPEGRRLQLVQSCLRIFLLPYYTIIDADSLAAAHLKEPAQGQEPVGEISPQPRTWDRVVEVLGMGIDSFLVIRSPVESGESYSPQLAAAKVIRHPSGNSPVILDPRPGVLDLSAKPPLISGTFADDGGVARYVWPALRRWRPQADTRRTIAPQDPGPVTTVLKYACKATGADERLVTELLTFLRAFQAPDGKPCPIATFAPEILAAEMARWHRVGPETEPSGLTTAQRVPPYVWDALSTGLNAQAALAGRHHLWLFDHTRLIPLFEAAERTKGIKGDFRKWTAAMPRQLQRLAGMQGGAQPCWVCIKNWQHPEMTPEDWDPGNWAALSEDNGFIRALFESHGAAFPYEREKVIEVMAGRGPGGDMSS